MKTQILITPPMDYNDFKKELAAMANEFVEKKISNFDIKPMMSTAAFSGSESCNESMEHYYSALVIYAEPEKQETELSEI